MIFHEPKFMGIPFPGAYSRREKARLFFCARLARKADSTVNDTMSVPVLVVAHYMNSRLPPR